MAMSIHGALRNARDQLIPQVEKFGPQLLTADTIILDALTSHLEAQGIDPGSIAEENLNKAQRHIIAGFLIRRMREHLLEDRGVCGDVYDAQFKPQVGAEIVSHTQRGSIWLKPDVRKTFEYGAGVIEQAYTGGTEGRWWPVAFLKYYKLGNRAMELAKMHPPLVNSLSEKTGIPVEGIDLRVALRNTTLAAALPDFLRYIAYRVPDPEARPKAAHDLYYLVTMLAGLHLREFNQSFFSFDALVQVPIKVGDDGKYRADFSKAHELMRLAYPHIDPSQLVNAKFKCAAHAEIEGEPTDLERIGHAAINAAYARYNM